MYNYNLLVIGQNLEVFKNSYLVVLLMNFISSLLWVGLVFLLWPDNDRDLLVFVITILSVWSGGFVANAASITSLSIFLGPICLSMFICFLNMQGDNVWLMPALTLFYLGSLYKLAISSRAYIYRVSELSEQNHAYLDTLKEQNTRLERQNKTLKDQEAQLVNKERMELVSEMAAGIAHEVNNPLMVISGSIELLRTMSSGDNPEFLNKNFARIKNHIARISTITESLAVFASRNEKYQFEHVTVGDLTTAIENSVTDFLEGSVTRLRFANDSQSGRVMIDLLWCSKVISSLIYNSHEALQSSGSKSPMINVIFTRSNDFLYIQIVDNGPGIPESQVKKIFNAFHTTKLSSKGTGLGLPLALKVVTDLGGGIEFIPRGDGYTEFKVSIPVKPSK